VVPLLLVAVSVGLSNFAASVGLGAGGMDRRTVLLVAVIFGLFEGGMPALGVLLGRSLATTLGQAAHWAGAGLLVATGAYALAQAARTWRQAARPAQPGRHGPDGQARASPPAGADPPPRAGQPVGRLVITGLALSMDNLVVGFAVGTFQVSLVTAVIVIGAVSVALSLGGLGLGSLLGARLGARTGNRGEAVSGLVLIGVGVAVAAGAP
jgi:putative Mn2+ efflux pump MntP